MHKANIFNLAMEKVKQMHFVNHIIKLLLTDLLYNSQKYTYIFCLILKNLENKIRVLLYSKAVHNYHKKYKS